MRRGPFAVCWTVLAVACGTQSELQHDPNRKVDGGGQVHEDLAHDSGQSSAARDAGAPVNDVDAGVRAHDAGEADAQGPGAEAGASHFTDNGDGTVTDATSDLTWQQKAAPGRFEWDQAESYCKKLTLDGGGWRVPTKDELETLLIPNAAPVTIDARYFPNTPLDWFWTSTPTGVPGFVWIVDFMTGLSYPNVDPTYKSSLRCVR